MRSIQGRVAGHSVGGGAQFIPVKAARGVETPGTSGLLLT